MAVGRSKENDALNIKVNSLQQHKNLHYVTAQSVKWQNNGGTFGKVSNQYNNIHEKVLESRSQYF